MHKCQVAIPEEDGVKSPGRVDAKASAPRPRIRKAAQTKVRYLGTEELMRICATGWQKSRSDLRKRNKEIAEEELAMAEKDYRRLFLRLIRGCHAYEFGL